MRKRSLRELIDRGRQAGRSRLEASRFASRWLHPGIESGFSRDDAPVTLDALGKLIGPGCTVEGYRQLIAENPGYAERLIGTADEVLAGRFDVLGVRSLEWGTPVDWQLEPTSGKRSPLRPWKQLDSLDASTTGDKKFVWELNRQQYLTLLGRAFWSTGDDRYAAAVADHIQSWIRDNPPGRGINWVSSLELAFRSISWLWSLAMIRGWTGWSSLPLRTIAHSLYLHGRHVEAYLSTYTAPNTHLTGEALGLYYLGTFLPELKDAGRWRAKGRAILLDQLDRHVRADGVYFEQSTWYHRYTADFYSHLVLVASRTGDPLPDHVGERLQAMLDHLMWIMRPDGTSPRLGDDDGGRLVKLECREANDWRAVLSAGAVLFGRADFKALAQAPAEETWWLHGPAAIEAFRRIDGAIPRARSRAFADGGIHVMRSGWDSAANYLLVDCGPHGAESCSHAHAHADALAIELAALGKSMLVDPGTYSYTGSAEARNRFRSTGMHNTLTVDGLSSSVPAGPFSWGRVAGARVHCWHDHPMFTFFSGAHDGYERLDDPVRHERAILFPNREYWIMLDTVRSREPHDYGIHFHMAPAAEARLGADASHLTARNAASVLEVAFPGQEGRWRLVDDEVSEGYGARVTAPRATFTLSSSGDQAFMAVLLPRLETDPRAVVSGSAAKGLQIEFPAHVDSVRWRPSPAVEGGEDHDFEWAWLRRSGGASDPECALYLHGRRLRTYDVEVDWEQPVAYVVARRHDSRISLEFPPTAAVTIRCPAGAREICVNGSILTLEGGEVLVLSRDEIPQPRSAPHAAARCAHVRH